jgi:hypothetical protein
VAVNPWLFRVALLVAAARFKGGDRYGYVEQTQKNGAGFHSAPSVAMKCWMRQKAISARNS